MKKIYLEKYSNSIKALIKLIDKYETITLDEIKKQWDIHIKQWDALHHNKIPKALTGFGSTGTCTICKASLQKCNKCILNYKNTSNTQLNGCTWSTKSLKASYERIERADTPRKLLNAYKNRAKIHREYLTSLKLPKELTPKRL